MDHFKMKDEANCQLCGKVSNQNCRYLSAANPCDFMKTIAHEVMVWCSVYVQGNLDCTFSQMTEEAGQQSVLSDI